MERTELHVLHLARVVLEAETALSVTTGLAEGTFDTQLVRDANGLPALPATAVAGVLRHLWIDVYGGGEEAKAHGLFGYQEGTHGSPSRLTLTWGALLDGRGRPAEGLLLGEEARRLEEDEIFKSALQQADSPVVRDRVRLTHRGAAADRGKFDRCVLPAGHRFALELRLWSKDRDDPDWPRLLGLLAHPLFRLGGATRAGLGAMRLVSCHARSFDLKATQDLEAFRGLGRGLTDTAGLAPCRPTLPDDAGVVSGTLQLHARGFWRIGQGESLIGPDSATSKVADLLPQVEECITWNDDGTARQLRLCLLPGSALKGALAHRMAFHYRRLAGQWASSLPAVEDAEARPAGLEALLGAVKDNAPEDETDGRAGALCIDDAWIEVDRVQVARLMHNAIDRFTGGVRNRVLYEEESLFGGELAVRITLDERRLDRNLQRLGLGDADEKARIREAARYAFEDLCRGRLALGSRTTTGNGFFKGRIDGTLGSWLECREDTREVAA